MRSLLLHAHDDKNFEARLQVALDLARAFDAHLTILQPIAFDMAMPGDYFGVVSVDMAPVIREAAQQFRQKVEADLANEDVRWDWVDEIGMADTQMIQHGAMCDLAIVGASSPDSGPRGGPSSLAGILAVHCKAPILVVPDGAKGLTLGKPAVVAWNGSMEASRALRAAVPLLQHASAVHLVTVDLDPEDDDRMLPALAGARYLDRYGIKCDLVELPRGKEKVSDVLRQAAKMREAGMMVMGAYGQPRLIETLFGGVTARMLSEPELPLLLSH